MNRRELLTKAFLLAGACVLPYPAWAANRRTLAPNGRLTLGAILTAAFPAAKRAALHGRQWATHAMQQAHNEGRVSHARLGVFVERGTVTYPIQEVSVPLVWTYNDDLRSENDKINIVEGLIENSLLLTDDLLLDNMGAGTLVVSHKYCYDLGEIHRLQEAEGYVCKLWTAFAVLPPIGQ